MQSLRVATIGPFFLILTLSQSSSALSPSAPLLLHVSPKGDDRWSGLVAEPSRDGKDGPLATLTAALKIARTRERREEGATILLRGGLYELSEPIVVTEADSGASDASPLTIAAYRDEQPVLSGGKWITGWHRVDGKPDLWRSEIPEVREGNRYFRQLFIDGKRKKRARTPNNGFFRIRGESPRENPARINFKPGDIDAAWAKEGEVEVVALFSWTGLRMQIRDVDEKNCVATLSGKPSPFNKEKNGRYYIENASSAVDEPGEWHLEKRTGIASYFAEKGLDMAAANVVAPRLDELMVIKGDAKGKRPVHHIVIRGITFTHTDWTLGEQGYADTQAAITIGGDVRAEHAVDCTIEDCLFTQLGGYAVELGKGCRRNRIVGNEIVDIGAGGVRIGETTIDVDPFDQCNENIVSDNHMRDLGQIYPAAVGVLILQSGGNRIVHNHIHDLYYTAISVGWNWGYKESPCHDNVIEFNHLHDVGKEMLSDMGGIYTLGIQRGTVIRNNLVHDVNSFAYGGWGLYTDEGSSYIILENNVVYRCKSAAFHQHYGRENIVRNNIFALCKENQLMRSREEDHLSFTLTNNIVYFDSGNLLGTTWKNNRFTMDKNLYFDLRALREPQSIRFAGVTLAEWRKRGHDLHSLIADPLFTAPGKFDFSLKEGSPAFQLGFKPIDLSTVGVREKAKRDPR